MELDPSACYQALVSRDARFDGRFFVGVGSTGIYCRPVCPARTPREDRCAFFPSAAAAEKSGFRPCLRCRPELAPGLAPVDATGRLAARIAERLENGGFSEDSVADLAAEMAISERHLRRVVRGEFGVSPVELAQTQRLLLAKRLLTDTDLTITEVAFASGFQSIRRFNALFQSRYRLNPTAIRQSRRSRTGGRPDTLTCSLGYHLPFDWTALLRFLAARATPGCEAVEEGRYLRTVREGDRRGWLVVEPFPGRPTLRVTLSASLAPVILPVLRRLRRLFDLHADPEPILACLGPLAAGAPGLRVPGAFDGFETAVRAILGQQVSVRAATTLAGRLAQLCGEQLDTPWTALTHLAPTAGALTDSRPEELSALGILPARAETLVRLSRAVAAGELALAPTADLDAEMDRLLRIPGIGEWTVQYLAMRVYRWPDAFPHTDLALRRSMGGITAADLLARAEAWRPWRAYAAMHLWSADAPTSPITPSTAAP